MTQIDFKIQKSIEQWNTMRAAGSVSTDQNNKQNRIRNRNVNFIMMNLAFNNICIVFITHIQTEHQTHVY